MNKSTIALSRCRLGGIVDEDTAGGGNKSTKCHSKASMCAIKTTLTAALEMAPNLESLHIYIQGEARLTSYRLMNGQVPIIRSHSADHQKLLKELKVGPITGRPTDTITIFIS
ncbi:hypothetical protein Trydic_g18080 [Trypoxylus dichotomus]